VPALSGTALYFSRQAIPFSRDQSAEMLLERLAGDPSARSPWLLHIGMYAYRPATLLRLTALPPSPLEQLECLEQLRALDHGIGIRLAVVDHAAAGIDTPADYARFVARRRAA